jgi:general secretion pathway protein D
MRVRSILFLFLIIITIAQLMQSQTEQSIERKAKGQVVNPDEVVSFKSDVPYTKAIQSLGELSKKLDGRLIIDRSPLQGKDKSIGINIESMYWKDALELILRSNQLWYTDYPEYLEIASFEEIGKKQGDQTRGGITSRDISQNSSISGPTIAGPQTQTVVDSSEYFSKVRDISISCVFFDLNRTKLAENGMDFSIFRGSNLNLGVNILGATVPPNKVGEVATSRLNNQFTSITVQPTGSNLGVDIYAALKMFEADQLGEVISNSKIPVRSGLSSILQVGDDFSVLEKDFSGNTVQKFYPTGTILNIKPRIFKVGDMEFIDVQYKVEKSTFEATTVTTIIHKTSTSGSLTLLNGEESYIGGMYSNSEVITRQGVPLLKDLPWWVFGLRYIFGYDSKNIVKRELIVLLKAEILPSLEDRALKPQAEKNIIKESAEEMEKDLKKRRTEK